MADSIEEFNRKLEKLISDIPEWIQTTTDEIAQNDLAALISERVINTGINSTGGKFSKYSDSYKRTRLKSNRNVSFKNFEFTGEMWKKFNIVKTQKQGTSYTVSLGGTTQASKDRIRWGTDHEGIKIIGASKAEEKIVSELYEEQLIQFINKAL